MRNRSEFTNALFDPLTGGSALTCARKQRAAAGPARAQRTHSARLAVAVAICALLLTACGIQPDGDQFYYIEFSNDTRTAVVLWNYHVEKDDLARLQPGQSASIFASIDDSPQQMQVEDLHGHQVGCIRISFTSIPAHARLLVSATRPCDPHIRNFN